MHTQSTSQQCLPNLQPHPQADATRSSELVSRKEQRTPTRRPHPRRTSSAGRPAAANRRSSFTAVKIKRPAWPWAWVTGCARYRRSDALLPALRIAGVERSPRRQEAQSSANSTERSNVWISGGAGHCGRSVGRIHTTLPDNLSVTDSRPWSRRVDRGREHQQERSRPRRHVEGSLNSVIAPQARPIMGSNETVTDARATHACPLEA